MMQVEIGKLYLTKTGRIIELSEKDGELYDCRHCNFYTTDGFLSRCGKDSITQNNLKIVEELPFKLPLTPGGYTWVIGYPQFRIPEEGEFFIKYNGKKKTFGDVVLCDHTFQVPEGCEKRRLIVKPISSSMKTDVYKFTHPSKKTAEITVESINKTCEIPKGFVKVTYPSYVVRKQDKFVSDVCPAWREPFSSLGCRLSSLYKYTCITPIIPFDGAGRYKLANGKIVNLNSEISCLSSDNIESSYGTVTNWTWEKDGTIKGAFNDASELYLIEKLSPEVDTVSKTCTVKINGEDICATGFTVGQVLESVSNTFNGYSCLNHTITHPTPKMKTVKFAGNLIVRGYNYWVVGPAIDIAKLALKSIRYVTFVSAIAGISYGCFHQEQVKKVIVSYIPKVSVTAPQILK